MFFIGHAYYTNNERFEHKHIILIKFLVTDSKRKAKFRYLKNIKDGYSSYTAKYSNTINLICVYIFIFVFIVNVSC